MSERTYEIGKWYPWNGGRCPVPKKSVVNTQLDKGRAFGWTAEDLSWGHQVDGKIVAFCVTEYPDEVVKQEKSVTVQGGNLEAEWVVTDATCTYRGVELVEIHWKKEEAK